MARLENGKPSETQSVLGIKGKCCFCAERSSAFWMESGKPVEICGSCAERVLPQLLADAVEYSPGDPGPYCRTLSTVERRFWKALAGRFWRERSKCKKQNTIGVDADTTSNPLENEGFVNKIGRK